jgi:hypothetical protein
MTMPANHPDKEQRIAYLIEGYNNRTLTPKEHDELDNWVAESDENMREFEEKTGKNNHSPEAGNMKYAGYVKHMVRTIRIKGLRYSA